MWWKWTVNGQPPVLFLISWVLELCGNQLFFSALENGSSGQIVIWLFVSVIILFCFILLTLEMSHIEFWKQNRLLLWMSLLLSIETSIWLLGDLCCTSWGELCAYLNVKRSSEQCIRLSNCISGSVKGLQSWRASWFPTYTGTSSHSVSTGMVFGSQDGWDPEKHELSWVALLSMAEGLELADL